MIAPNCVKCHLPINAELVTPGGRCPNCATGWKLHGIHQVPREGRVAAVVMAKEMSETSPGIQGQVWEYQRGHFAVRLFMWVGAEGDPPGTAPHGALPLARERGL